MEKFELIGMYERALEVAENTEKLGCHINQIKAKMEEIQRDGYEVSVTDAEWVDYFLKMNYKTTRWYFTCMEDIATSIRVGTMGWSLGSLEVYSTAMLAVQLAHPSDCCMFAIDIPEYLVKLVSTTEPDYKIGTIDSNILQQLQYENSVLIRRDSWNPVPSDTILDSYYRLIDFTYQRYNKMRSEMKSGVILKKHMEWLIKHLYLEEADFEQLNHLWFAIDKYFREKATTTDENGKLVKREGVDFDWLKDCNSAWQEVLMFMLDRKKMEALFDKFNIPVVTMEELMGVDLSKKQQGRHHSRHRR